MSVCKCVKENRIGKVYVSKELLLSNGTDVADLIFRNLIIVRCECLIHMGERFEYIAYSHLFDEVDMGTEPPKYDIILHTNENREQSLEGVKRCD